MRGGLARVWSKAAYHGKEERDKGKEVGLNPEEKDGELEKKEKRRFGIFSCGKMSPFARAVLKSLSLKRHKCQREPALDKKKPPKELIVIIRNSYSGFNPTARTENWRG